MPAAYVNGNVRAHCPNCEAITTFEMGTSAGEFGSIINNDVHEFDGVEYTKTAYVLLRCAGCHRGGLAKIHCHGRLIDGDMEWFNPRAVGAATLPEDTPEGIVNEFREAERCAGAGAYRAASGMLRSTLEKVLDENGYVTGRLKARINRAALDGVITDAIKMRAREKPLALGNDVLHEPWREVGEKEYQEARHYVAKVIDAFYDDRKTVLEVLKKRKSAVETVPPPEPDDDEAAPVPSPAAAAAATPEGTL
jgi:hypothetical protein